MKLLGFGDVASEMWFQFYVICKSYPLDIWQFKMQTFKKTCIDGLTPPQPYYWNIFNGPILLLFTPPSIVDAVSTQT